MKTEKKAFIRVEFVLLIILSIVIGIMLKDKNKKDPVRISVVVQNSQDSQWSAFKYGLDMAARNQNIEFNYVCTGDTMTAEEENNSIQQEVKQGADGVIVQPIDHGRSSGISKQEVQGVPIVLVECEAETDKKDKHTSIVNDNYSMGKRLAEEIINDFSYGLDEKRIGVLYTGSDTKLSEDRKQGFADTLRTQGIEIYWDRTVRTYDDLKTELSNVKLDILVALDDVSLKEAGKYYSSEKIGQALLYGIASSEEAIYYLDTRIAECLVIPDSFSEGYHSINEVVKQIKNPFYKPVKKTVDFKVLTRENLFAEENQQLLYTISQSN